MGYFWSTGTVSHSKHRHWLPICLVTTMKRKYKEQIDLSLSLGDWYCMCFIFTALPGQEWINRLRLAVLVVLKILSTERLHARKNVPVPRWSCSVPRIAPGSLTSNRLGFHLSLITCNNGVIIRIMAQIRQDEGEYLCVRFSSQPLRRNGRFFQQGSSIKNILTMNSKNRKTFFKRLSNPQLVLVGT
jgi:hypothetical protein